MNRKLKNISFLQNFGIFLVVLGHSLPSEGIPSGIEWMRSLIYSFHMPLFMAISGFLYIYSNGTKGNYSRFIKNKFLRLLVPYLSISTITFIPKVILSRYAYRPVAFSVSAFIENLVYPSENVIIFFWFLPTLFIIFLVSPILEKGTKSLKLQVLLTLLLIFANVTNLAGNVDLFSLNNVSKYLIYFWMGCLMASHWKQMKPILEKTTTFLFLISLLFVLNFLEFDNSILNLITASVGILGSVSLSIKSENYKHNVFGLIDGYNFQIYLLSWFPQTFFIIILLGKIPYVLLSLILLLSGLILPVIISKMIRKYFPLFNIFLGMNNSLIANTNKK